ncbi:hypothetical protein V8F33_007007 [Rhypophila sp. PSN 637]
MSVSESMLAKLECKEGKWQDIKPPFPEKVQKTRGSRSADVSTKKAITLNPTAKILDDDGDLTLVVGADKTNFVVCSRTVSRASPVFRQMLNGPFIEARPPADSDDPWIVTLPEDKSEIMTIILCIMHGQFAKVPQSVATARSTILKGLFCQLAQAVVNLEILVTDRYTGTSQRPEAYCAKTHNTWGTGTTRRLCHAATLGLLHAWLGKLLQYAPRPAHYMEHAWVPKISYPDSVNKAIETIKTFKWDLYDNGIHSSGYHQKQPYGCNPIAALLEDTDKLVKEHRVIISKENIARMKEQQQKLGVNWDFLSKSN